jgi:hypothetical protein
MLLTISHKGDFDAGAGNDTVSPAASDQTLRRPSMTSIRKTTGATLAAAAAALLMGGAISLTTAPASADSVHCGGINACKGQSACKSASNSCKGQNACKGQGWVEQSSAEACTAAGGTVIEG